MQSQNYSSELKCIFLAEQATKTIETPNQSDFDQNVKNKHNLGNKQNDISRKATKN